MAALAQPLVQELDVLGDAAAGFKQADVIFVPTAPTIYTAQQIEKKPIELNNHLGHYTSFANLLDLAAVSLPAGMRPDGVPFGVSLIAPAFTDKSLLALGQRFLG